MLDPATREVSRGGRDILLTRTEYNLLECLMYRVGKVAPRRSLIEAVWGFDRDIEENTLDALFACCARRSIPKTSPSSFIRFAEWGT